ncbi:7-cyano-7-deazaguanine synthase [Frateuria sp. GZRR35]|uniref:7-cyano-7-deazaguanine synthase n=1 Tax=Frateuria sp. GZRR35 TaxID=3351536 RepID=UPI003EDB9CA6
MYDHYVVTGSHSRVLVKGEVHEQALNLNADGFFKALLVLPHPRSLDLLRIAAGIYTIDRITKRKKRSGNEHGMRRISAQFEVDDLPFWSSSSVGTLLWQTIKLLTEDAWELSFVSRRRPTDDLGYQSYLPIVPAPEQLALYSGGLDSAAGLASQLLQGADNLMLITVAHHTGIPQVVQRQLAELKDLLDQQLRLVPQVHHSTLSTFLSGGKAVRLRTQEKTQRSRAFFFCAAAVLAAEAYGLDEIQMFENGVGSINLPPMGGMLGTSLATRGAHPAFLRLMSELASEVVGEAINIRLPNAQRTKGEMLKEIAAEGLGGWVQASRSCVHSSLRISGVTHCGECPACVERRQAFAVAGVPDDGSHYALDIFNESPVSQDNSDYLHLYKKNALGWLNSDPAVLRRMENHLRSTQVPADVDEWLGMLHQRHAQEVLAVYGPREFLSNGSEAAVV